MFKLKRKGEEFDVLVSEEDEDLLRVRNWHIGKNGYAVTNIKLGVNKWTQIYLHREIARRMGITEAGMFVDHINRDKLDNRRDNLRKATPAQSVYNTSRPGVFWDKSRGRWTAKIQKQGKLIWMGRFEQREDAVRERAKRIPEIFGEFAPC